MLVFSSALAIKRNTTMNILILVLWYQCVKLLYGINLQVELLTGREWECLYLKDNVKLFSNRIILIYISIQKFSLIPSLSKLVSHNSCQSSGYDMEIVATLITNSLLLREVSMSSYNFLLFRFYCLFLELTHFYLGCLIIFFLICKNSLYTL